MAQVNPFHVMRLRRFYYMSYRLRRLYRAALSFSPGFRCVF
jgi:hypothetical protein